MGSFTNNNIGQSSIQDIQAVETHNLQSSEGQLRKLTELFGVDVMATPSFEHNEVNARSDDLLALQTEQRLEHDLSGTAEVVSSLNPDLEISVSKSQKFTNCILARPVAPTPPSRFQERRQEMEEIGYFLKKDPRFYTFPYLIHPTSPGKGREDWLLNFFREVYRHHNFKEDQALFEERCRAAGQYINLMDEDNVDEGVIQEEIKLIDRDYHSSYFDPDRGWVHVSYVPYNVGQCERTSGPSHVVDGGSDALEPDPMKSERTSGPSHVEDGGGDALQRVRGVGGQEYSGAVSAFPCRFGPSQCWHRSGGF
jgi:hypothetical protein